MKAVKNKEIKKDIYNMLIPMIFESILQTSAGLISTAMLGRLLADDVSAQGLALRISETLWCLYRGIAIGATILIARSIGKNDRNQCKHTTQQTILSAMPIAIISMILLLTFPTQILSFFSKETELLNKAVIFLKIAIWGFPSTVIMSAVTASFQGHGNTKTPMLLAGLLNIVNIITGYVFIFGFAFIPAMGIKGSAIALVLSQTVTALVGLILLFGKK
ncbi:MAG: MATE family efflux transporter [Oscillospiraceae bacterium]